MPLRFLSDGNFSIGIHGENSFLSSDLQLGILLNFHQNLIIKICLAIIFSFEENKIMIGFHTHIVQDLTV